jgi:hypothetical protein
VLGCRAGLLVFLVLYTLCAGFQRVQAPLRAELARERPAGPSGG